MTDMKLVQISFHFEYADDIEELLDSHRIAHFVRHSMIQGLDSEGRQYGSKAFPGHITLIQARCDDETVPGLLDDLESFRTRKRSHNHLEALVLPVEERIGPENHDEKEGKAKSERDE